MKYRYFVITVANEHGRIYAAGIYRTTDDKNNSRSMRAFSLAHHYLVGNMAPTGELRGTVVEKELPTYVLASVHYAAIQEGWGLADANWNLAAILDV